MKVFTDYIVVLLKARKAGWYRELPARKNAQQRKCHFQNYPDYKAQYQKTCNDCDDSYDLRRYNL